MDNETLKNTLFVLNATKPQDKSVLLRIEARIVNILNTCNDENFSLRESEVPYEKINPHIYQRLSKYF